MEIIISICSTQILKVYCPSNKYSAKLKSIGMDVFDVWIPSKVNISYDSIHDCGLANKRSAFIIDVCLVWKVVKTQFIDTMNSFFNDRSYSIQFFVTCLLTKSGYRIEWILSSYMIVIEKRRFCNHLRFIWRLGIILGLFQGHLGTTLG